MCLKMEEINYYYLFDVNDEFVSMLAIYRDFCLTSLAVSRKLFRKKQTQPLEGLSRLKWNSDPVSYI